MNIITVNDLAVLAHETPSQYIANCSKDFGCFIQGRTKDMNILEAKEAGLVMGKWVEMVLITVKDKILTFEPHFINEPFVEIWGIPVAGEIKEQFPEKASELCHFLIHKQSKDRFYEVIDTYGKKGFLNWVVDGKEGDVNEYVNKAKIECFLSHVFRFEFIRTESSGYTYHFVQTSIKKVSSEVEKLALEVSQHIHQEILKGTSICVNQRLEENQNKCLGIKNVVSLTPAKETKQLKQAKA